MAFCWETKIINQIAITYSEEGKHRQAIEIYRQLIRYVESHFPDCEVRQVMLPLTAYNYSRLLGLERRYEEAIEVAELGNDAGIIGAAYVALRAASCEV